MSDIKLGQFITGDADRDAIHIAIAPMVAETDLEPGAYVGVFQNGNAGLHPVPIGIVDPFLRRTVRAGERFWLCLYQQTVTGMRHAWSHPAFTTEPRAQASMFWLKDYADQIGLDYVEMMAAATKYVDSYEEFYFDPKSDGDSDLPDGFWEHFKNATGKVGTGTFFKCCY